MKAKQFSAILLSVVLIMALSACGSSPTQQPTSDPVGSSVPEGEAASDPAALIVGEWEHEGGAYAYKFEADGSGTYNYGETVMKFSFEADGSSLSISYEGAETPTVLEYSLDGSVLNIKDSFGSDTIYNKK